MTTFRDEALQRELPALAGIIESIEQSNLEHASSRTKEVIGRLRTVQREFGRCQDDPDDLDRVLAALEFLSIDLEPDCLNHEHLAPPPYPDTENLEYHGSRSRTSAMHHARLAIKIVVDAKARAAESAAA